MNAKAPSAGTPAAAADAAGAGLPAAETVDSSVQAVSTMRGVRVVGFFGKYGTLVVLGVMIVLFTALLGTDFFAVDNFRNILLQSAIGVVIALGLTVVLMVGEFDLSVGYTASLAGVLTATLYGGSGGNKALMVLAVLAVGGLVGLVNGLVVTKLGVNALVGTLGVGSLVVGVNYIVTEGTPQSLEDSGRDLLNIYLNSLGPIPWAVILLLAVTAVLWLLLNRTTFGLEVQAVGGNRTAAELSGIRTHRVVISAFVIGGTLAALGGLMITANVGSGQSGGGDGFLLSSFAAAFLGSAALRNGEFHVLGTLIGVLTVAVGINGMAIYGVTASASYIFQGALLICAVGMSTAARRMISGRRVGH